MKKTITRRPPDPRTAHVVRKRWKRPSKSPLNGDLSERRKCRIDLENEDDDEKKEVLQ